MLITDKVWLDDQGKEYTDQFIKEEIESYVKLGGKIYVGSDSMLYSDNCSFACVIAFHNNSHKIAKYYFKRFKRSVGNYKNLRVKILEEVALSIQVANFVINLCPSADVELHVDIGTSKRSATSKMFNLIKGWVLGTGFKLKVKPESWASSSIADWHTK